MNLYITIFEINEKIILKNEFQASTYFLAI